MRSLYLLFFLLFPAVAHAATTSSDQSASGPSPQKRCGATAADAIAQAHKLLAKPDAVSERAALGCLIEAMTEVDAHVRALDLIRTPSGMMHVIDADHPPAASR